MIIGKAVRHGNKIEQDFPCVKRWQSTGTYALFSSSFQAVIICVDPSHEDDFVGQAIDDCSNENWERVDNFEITISSN